MREYISLGVHVAYWFVIVVLLVIAIGGELSQPSAPPGYAVNQTQPNSKDYSEQDKFSKQVRKMKRSICDWDGAGEKKTPKK